MTIVSRVCAWMCLSLLVFTLCACGTPRTQPNIILILADDLGWTDLGFMGSSFYRTPRLDSLAMQGMEFTQAYSPGPNCAPSRACILTGQYSPRHGIYTVNSSERGKSEARRLIPTPNITTLADDALTLAEVLKQGGYVCASIGKWHLGPEPESGPRTQGFDVSIAASHIGHPPAGYFAPFELPDLEGAPEGEYLTDRLTDEALNFIESHQDRPFFLYLSHYAVHTPLQAPEQIIAAYRDRPASRGHNNPVYAAMVENLDTNIGRVLDKLTACGLADKTLVIFFSDNGGLRRVTSADPLRGGKGMLYEGGIRVPLIVAWPGRIRSRGTSEIPVSGVDLFPTLLEAAEITPPAGVVLDGRSLVPLFSEQGSLGQEDLYWFFPAYLEGKAEGARDPVFRTRPAAAIRSGDWKLIEYFEDGELELYNLMDDAGESRNLALVLPEKARELHEKMREWRRSLHAPVPTQLNPDYKTREGEER